MDRLWAPWRIKYVQAVPERGCIFCLKPRQKQDKKNYIISRKSQVFSMLNLYPYNNGHLLVSPYRHVDDFVKLTEEERTQLMSLTSESLQVLKKYLKPQGFNVGFNIGKAAGAGIDQHLHMHIVPRWNGDTNFMPVMTGTKIISQSLDELYELMVK